VKFGKKRSAPEPEPIDITQRLSILDLRDSARPGAEAGSGVPATPGTATGAPAPSEADALPGRVIWKPTIYQPPAPGTAVPADVLAEAITAPQPVVAAPMAVAPPAPAPEPAPDPAPAYAPADSMPAHFADAARYEAAAFELPSFVPPPVEPEPVVAPTEPDAWDLHGPASELVVEPHTGSGEPAHEPWTHDEPTPLEPAPPAYAVPTTHGVTTAELPPFEPQTGAGEPVHEPWADHVPTPLEPAYPRHDEPTPLEPAAHVHAYSEPEAQVPDARVPDESPEPVQAASTLDLIEPVATVPEQVVDLTETPEPVHAAVAEPPAADRRPVDDDSVIRWTW
jgi:hypothetical protein